MPVEPSVRDKYGIDALLARIPEDRGEFFEGFVPWHADVEGFVLSHREPGPATAEHSALRTVWDHAQERELRVLIETVACASARDAVELLATQLSYNQLERLPAGPAELGLASFVHPEPAPPAVFFVRGNLSVMLASFGRRSVPVLPLAARLAARLGERPQGERRRLLLRSDAPRLKPGAEAGLSYDAPSAVGADAYAKLFVTGGTLVRRAGRLVVRAAVRGSVGVEAFVVEPLRDAYAGELSLPVD